MIQTIRLKNRFDILDENLEGFPDDTLLHVIDKKGAWILTTKEEIKNWKKCESTFGQLQFRLVYDNKES